MRLFPYSGSKERLVKWLPGPPPGTSTIIEPFAGSAAWGLHWRSEKLLLAEANPLVHELWAWLIGQATEQDLHDIQDRLDALKAVGDKSDLRDAGFRSRPALTLARLMTSGVVVGQLSSWVHYAQHAPDLTALVGWLPYIQDHVRLVGTDWRQAFQGIDPTALVFCDPPYMGTEANYKGSGKDFTTDESAAIMAAIQAVPNPVLLTYGDGATERFPGLDWQVAVKRKVPNLRKGGTVDRTEWFCRIRF